MSVPAPTTGGRPGGPLSGLRVLDLSRILAGPWASQVLADLGADVIKVERPSVGDDTRQWGPPFVQGQDGTPRESAYFLSANRGKRSIALDIATAAGQDTVRAIAETCDIVVENFKAGTLARYGLDYLSLSALRPGLIYCSITGFGQSGPRHRDAAYDFVIQAASGLMSVTGEPDEKPGGGPEKVGVPIIDLMTGMYAAVGVLAALARRHATGEGEYIDLAMLDVGVSLLSNRAMSYLVSGAEPRRTGNAHPNIQPQDVFAAADGHLVLAVGNDAQFRQLCDVLGHPGWAEDPSFATNAARVRHEVDLSERLADCFRRRPLDEWVRVLGAAGVPAGPINTLARVVDDPQVRHRGLIQPLPHPEVDGVRIVGPPYAFRHAGLDACRAAPLLGEHTEEIRAELRSRAGTGRSATGSGSGP